MQMERTIRSPAGTQWKMIGAGYGAGAADLQLSKGIPQRGFQSPAGFDGLWKLEIRGSIHPA
jgi:hypothetical protein